MTADPPRPRLRVRSSLLANFAGQGWTAIANIAVVPFYVASLGVESYGLIGIFVVVITVTALLDAGMTPTINREMVKYRTGERDAAAIHRLLRSIELLCFGLAASLCIAGVLASGWIVAAWSPQGALSPALIARALALMFVAANLRVVEGLYRAALLGLDRVILLNALSIGFVTLRTFGVLLVFRFWSTSIEIFFLWQVGTLLLSLMTFALVTHLSLPRVRQHFSIDWASLAEIRGFALGIFGASLLSTVLTQADKLLIAKLVPLRDFGYYALATTVAGGLYQLMGPIFQTYYPRLAEIFSRGDHPALSHTYHGGAQLLALILASPAAMMIFFAHPALLAWTGNAQVADHAAPIMRFLAIGGLVHCLLHMPIVLQWACGWPSLAARINLVGAAILFPLLLIVVPREGVVAAAMCWAGVAILIAAGSVTLMHRRLLRHEGMVWLLHDVGPPVAAALGVAALFSLLSMPSGGGVVVAIAFLGLVTLAAFAASALTLPIIRQRLGALVARRA